MAEQKNALHLPGRYHAKLRATINNISDEFEECDIEVLGSVLSAIQDAHIRAQRNISTNPAVFSAVVEATNMVKRNVFMATPVASWAAITNEFNIMREAICAAHSANREVSMALTKLMKEYYDGAEAACTRDGHEPDLARKYLFKYANALQSLVDEIIVEN